MYTTDTLLDETDSDSFIHFDMNLESESELPEK